MRKWEYQITRYNLQDLAGGEEEIFPKAFYCDSKGQCFLHDTSQAASDMIRDTFNAEGKEGWELVQFGYHHRELMCLWKRPVD